MPRNTRPKNDDEELTRLNYRHMFQVAAPAQPAERLAQLRAWLADMERFDGTCTGSRAEWLTELITAIRRAVESHETPADTGHHPRDGTFVHRCCGSTQ